MRNPIEQISALGQAIWLDFISRDMLQNGELQRLVDEGITGVTSNPTIFQKAIAEGSLYDADIERLSSAGKTTMEIYEGLVVRDITDACDVLRAVYDRTSGRDGFVSLEVNPHLAHSTDETVAEARRLYGAVNRPNLMIKVPATEAGLPAITTLLGDGINVNVTLIFALDMYQRVMAAYIEGLRRFQQTAKQTGRSFDSIASVASFFVSRVDTLTDKVLDHRVEHGEGHLDALMGKAAVANAKIAYAKYKEIFEGPMFTRLRLAGARVQRPLWASTSTKNPHYPDTMYVDPLIGVNTVNTVPPETLQAIRDHAVVGLTIEEGLDHAYSVIKELENVKVDMNWVTACLLEEGVQKFTDSFDQLLVDLEKKREQLTQATP